MEIHELRIFLAVAEELHFARAAERLHLAQPPVSRTIKQLEHELGAALFIRTTRSVRLTAAGAALVDPAMEILAAIDRAKTIVTAADAGDSGTVTIAYSGGSTHKLVGILAREVKKLHPNVDFRLSSQEYALPALTRVVKGEVDISIGRWDVVPSGVDARIIAQEHLVLAVPASHRLAARKEVRIAELAEESFVALPSHEGSILDDRFRRLSLAAGYAPDIVQRAPDSWSVMALVGAGIGCSLTVSAVAESATDPHVRFLRVLDDTQPIYLRMAWRRQAENPALAPVLAQAEVLWPDRSIDDL